MTDPTRAIISRALMKSTDVRPTARSTSAVSPRIAALETVFVAIPANNQHTASNEISVDNVFKLTGTIGIGANQPPFAANSAVLLILKTRRTKVAEVRAQMSPRMKRVRPVVLLQVFNCCHLLVTHERISCVAFRSAHPGYRCLLVS